MITNRMSAYCFLPCALFFFLTGCSSDGPVEDTPAEITKKTNFLNEYEFAYGSHSNFISDIVDVQDGTYVIGTYSNKEQIGMSIAADYVVNDQKFGNGYRNHFDGLVPLNGTSHHGNTLYLFFSKENDPDKTELVVLEKGTVVYQNNAIAKCNSNGEIIKRVFSDSEAFEFVQSDDNLMVEVRSPWQEQYRCKKSLSFKLESTSRIEVFDEDENTSFSFYQVADDFIRVYQLDLKLLKMSPLFSLPSPKIPRESPLRAFKEGENYVFLFSVLLAVDMETFNPAKYYKTSLNEPDNDIDYDLSSLTHINDYFLSIPFNDGFLFFLVANQEGNIVRKRTIPCQTGNLKAVCVKNGVLNMLLSKSLSGGYRLGDDYFIESLGLGPQKFYYDFEFNLKTSKTLEFFSGIKCQKGNSLLIIGSSVAKCQIKMLDRESICNKVFIKTSPLY